MAEKPSPPKNASRSSQPVISNGSVSEYPDVVKLFFACHFISTWCSYETCIRHGHLFLVSPLHIIRL
jgi:hypothetical protein